MLKVKRPSWETSLDKEQVHKAATALLKFIAENKAGSNNLLEDDADWINLFIRYKTVPVTFSKTPVLLELPHPFWSTNEFRICLIISDKKSGTRLEKAKEVLEPDHVTEVKSSKEIRKLYRDVQSKTELCRSFDLFLMDSSLRDVTTELLCGRFVDAKKFPSMVTLSNQPESWVGAIEAAKKTTQMFCYVQQVRTIRIGRSHFASDQLTENFLAVVRQMMEKEVDGGWAQILQLYMSTGEHIKLPVYQTFPDEPLVEEDIPSAKKRPLNSRSAVALKKRLIDAVSDGETALQ